MDLGLTGFRIEWVSEYLFLRLSGLVFLDDVGWVGDDGGRVWSERWYCWVCEREGQ